MLTGRDSKPKPFNNVTNQQMHTKEKCFSRMPIQISKKCIPAGRRPKALPHISNVAITFRNKTHNKARKLANMSYKQYTAIQKKLINENSMIITKALWSRKDPNPVWPTEKKSERPLIYPRTPKHRVLTS